MRNTVRDLCSLIAQLPPENRYQFVPVLAELEKQLEHQKALLSEVHQLFDELRLEFAYLRFDLEATRRERDEALANG